MCAVFTKGFNNSIIYEFIRDHSVLSLFVLGLVFLPTCKVALADAPVIYSNPNYQSPVRAEADDLLLLPGYGFSAQDTVVYQSIDDTEAPFVVPTLIPNPVDNNTNLGVASIVNTADIPYSLTLKLPDVITNEQSYVIWVVNDKGEWSNGIKINDARPLWISPSKVYETQKIGNLDRYLKIVGKNLQSNAQGRKTKIRFIGPNSESNIFAMKNAFKNINPLGLNTTAIDNYVAKIDLPAAMQTGEYFIDVSRDNVSWVRLNQKLTVMPDPVAPTEFLVENYGGCLPDELDDPLVNPDPDDTLCVINAINAAKASGGVLVFGPGTWRVIDGDTAGTVFRDGIVVPVGVSLQGAGSSLTTLVRDKDWKDIRNNQPRPVFTLQGDNSVKGFTFKDEKAYQSSDANSWMLQLGRSYTLIYYKANEPKITQNITITENVFDKPLIAIQDGGLPIDNIFVTKNTFGAYKYDINSSGDRYNNMFKFHINNAVITNNIFKPGSYIAPPHQGAIATQLGAGHRVDFSNNLTDGSVSAIDFLNDPADPSGWRAAHFWSMNNNTEMMLVSENVATCTGDKAGDGEAFAYDNNGNTFAFAKAQTVLSATSNTVTVPGPLKDIQNSRDLTVTNPVAVPAAPYLVDYYNEHWISIPEGKGLGQVRQIINYTINPNSVTFTIEPSWDVIPDKSSRITAAREFWQVNTVDNIVDQRSPLCTKANQGVPEGGAITLWAQVADSAVENNQMHDTDGITLQQTYSSDQDSYTALTFFQSFVDVRGNTIDGEYKWDSDCSQSGLWGSYSAAPTDLSPPPVAGYGVSFSHNVIRKADGLRGGAISLSRGWHAGPLPSAWKLVNNTLIYHNEISEISGIDPSKDGCDNLATRVGINIYDALAWRTTLYGNTCNATVDNKLIDNGTSTVRVCSSTLLDSCECDNITEADLQLNTAASFNQQEGLVIYEITLTNNSVLDVADVTFSVEPEVSSIIDASSGSAAYDLTATCVSCLPDPIPIAITCTPEVRTCTIDQVASGATLKFNVYGTGESGSVATTNFSVVHSGYDPVSTNNGATVDFSLP